MLTITRETHDTPPEIARILTLAGGLNRLGEPNFRAVWGWNRLGWIGGRWTDRDASGAVIREIIGVRRVPKYIPHNRWHIERWCPPESYGSPEQWARATLEIEDGINVPALGPYPSRGEYEHVWTLEAAASAESSLVPQPLSSKGASSRTTSTSRSSATPCHSERRCGASAEESASVSGVSIATPCTDFVQLTPTIAERIARMIEFSRAVCRAESREALLRREAARDRAYDSFADAVLSSA
jgi:hypothetical protein